MSRNWRIVVCSSVFFAVGDVAFGQGPHGGKPPKTALESMHVGARITEAGVNVRQGPGSEYNRTRLIDRHTRVTVTALEGRWIQVTLPSGATGWVCLKFVDPEAAIVAPKAPAQRANASPAAPAVFAGRATPVAAQAQSTPTLAPGAQKVANDPAKPATTAVAAPAAAPKSAVAMQKDLLGALSGAKPDVLVGAKESAPASIGDTFRMLLVLLPVLGGIVLAVRGLKSVQQRTGSLPDFHKGLRGAILGGFNANNARSRGGSSLRVLESIPIGAASLHLVEARGRLLLLGASGGSLSTLSDLTETRTGGVPTVEDSDFRSVLNSMSDDLEEDYSDLRGGLGVVVESLEDQIREARDSISRSAVRGRK